MLHVLSRQNPLSLVLGADNGIDGNPVQRVKEQDKYYKGLETPDKRKTETTVKEKSRRYPSHG